VRFAGLIHPGLIGTAPSAELLAMWNEREKALVDEEGTPAQKTTCGYCHTRPLACLPNKSGAMLGTLGHCSSKMGADAAWDKVASEAARTVPGRENGGNCDMCEAPLPIYPFRKRILAPTLK
jgi:formamidase